MKAKLIITIALTALVSVTLTYALVRVPVVRAEVRAPEAGAGEEKPAQIAGLKTARATAGAAWEVVTATGTVAPDLGRSVKIGPRVAGKVDRVYAQVGDAVRAGQVLATISSAELAQARAAYRQAAAKLQAARENSRQRGRLSACLKRPAKRHAEPLAAQGELAMQFACEGTI
jgi:multidrug efflux pump subunit AcrA (membrane-fusion protein)